MSDVSVQIFNVICTYYEQFFLSGNKKDLENQREVNFTDAKAFAQQHNMIGVVESSAKENINVEEIFVKLAKVLDFYRTCL